MYVDMCLLGCFHFLLAHWKPYSVTLVFLSCYPGGNRNLGTWQLLRKYFHTYRFSKWGSIPSPLPVSLQDLSYSPTMNVNSCQTPIKWLSYSAATLYPPLPNPLMIINLLKFFSLLPGKEHSGRSESPCFLLQFSWKKERISLVPLLDLQMSLLSCGTPFSFSVPIV